LPFIDAMNIDVKSYTDDYYRKVCGGRLAPVLETVRESVEAGCHVEVTTLLLPGLNDSEEEVEELARWLGALGRGIPLHFSKYFPNYQFDLPPTSDASLVRAREVAMKHLDYVYLGNVWGEMGSNTICPGCGAVVMQRRAMELRAVNMNGTSCARCGREIAVRGKVMRPEGE
jgi:pyruvate formate lyase activating enzyme